MLSRRNGQSTLEYAMIIAVVVAALLAIQIYMKRGVQGKLRSSADDIGAQFDAGKTKVVSETSRTGVTIEETVLTGSGVVTTVSTGEGPSTKAEESTSSGSESVGAFK